MGFVWVSGTVKNNAKVLDIEILWGKAILGDFKFSVLGTQNEEISNFTSIRKLKIRKNSTLYIQENFESFRYIHPELYLGIVIGNKKNSAECSCYGNIIVDEKLSYSILFIEIRTII